MSEIRAGGVRAQYTHLESQELVSRNSVLRAFGPDVELVRADLIRGRLEGGQVLNEPGEEIRNVFFPIEGVVSKFAVFESGQEVECVLTGRNSAVGAFAAMGVVSALTRDVSVMEADGLSLPRARLEWACRNSTLIASAVARCCEAQMTYAIRIGACNAVHGIEQRLSRWLLCCSSLLSRNDIHLRQEVFARVLGVQRSSINPMLQRFQSDGLIELGRSRLSIVDPAGLRRRAC